MKKHWIEAGLLPCVRFVFNNAVGNSLYPHEFDSFVEHKLSERQAKIIKFNNLSLDVSPELAHRLSNSKMVSSMG